MKRAGPVPAPPLWGSLKSRQAVESRSGAPLASAIASTAVAKPPASRAATSRETLGLGQSPCRTARPSATLSQGHPGTDDQDHCEHLVPLPRGGRVLQVVRERAPLGRGRNRKCRAPGAERESGEHLEPAWVE